MQAYQSFPHHSQAVEWLGAYRPPESVGWVCCGCSPKRVIGGTVPAVSLIMQTLCLGSTRHSAVLTLTSLPSGLYLRGALTAGFEPTTSHFAKWGSTRLSYGGGLAWLVRREHVSTDRRPS